MDVNPDPGGSAGAGPVVLRACSGPAVGMGHVMRSRAVAQEVVRLGGHALFVVDDAMTAEALRGEPFEVRLASGAWLGRPFRSAWLDGFVPWEEELAALEAASTPVFLVENRTEARDHSKRVVYPALHFVPDAWDLEHPGRVLAGAPFVPLSTEVRATRPFDPPDIDLLVTFGGSDPNRLTERILPLLRRGAGSLAIGVGHHMADRRDGILRLAEGLRGAAPGAREVHVLEPGTPLSPWMARSRVALTALGTTLYELAYLGVPALILANYPEDQPALSWYDEHGPHRPLGVHDELGDAALRTSIGREIQALWTHARTRPEGLGGGARRLARALLAA